MTGEVYNKTAEFAQDVEDRALRGQMAGLGLRKPFVVGWLTRALRGTVLAGKQKSSRQLRAKYINPDELKTLKPKSAKARKNSEFNVPAENVHNMLINGDITLEEAKFLLKDYGYKDQTIKKILRSFKEINYKLGDDFVSYGEPKIWI